MGYHLLKLTGRRAPLPLAEETATPGRSRADGAAYKNPWVMGTRTVSGWRTRSDWGTAVKGPSQKLGLVWEGSQKGC